MQPLTLSLVDFLLTAEAQAALAELAGQELGEQASLTLLARLRRGWQPDQAAALLDQARLRRKAGAKFPHPDRLLFIDDALQQASSRAVATYRAGQFLAALNRLPLTDDRSSVTVADLGCGLGADTIALAEAGLHVLAIEIDPVRARIAVANIAALGLAERVEVVCGDWRTEAPALTLTLSQREREPESAPPLPLGEGWGEGAPPLPLGEGWGEGAPPLPPGAGQGEGAPPLPLGEGQGKGVPPLPLGEGWGEGAPPLPLEAGQGKGVPPLPLGEGWGEGAPPLPLGAGQGEGAPPLPLGAGQGEGAPPLPLGAGQGEGAPPLPLEAGQGKGAPPLPLGEGWGEGAPPLPLGEGWGEGAPPLPLGAGQDEGAPPLPLGEGQGEGAPPLPLGAGQGEGAPPLSLEAGQGKGAPPLPLEAGQGEGAPPLPLGEGWGEGAPPLPLGEGWGEGLLAAFIDPSRRAGEQRIFRLDAMDPPLSAVLTLLAHIPTLAVKTLPGIADEDIPPDAEVEFISERGQMKEALLRFGALHTGAARRATLLPGPHHLDSNAALSLIPISPPLAWLYEPDAAVIRATLVQHLATQLGAAQLDPTIAYLTAEQPVETPFARGWAVLRHGPFHLKTLNRWLRELGAGAAVVKKRGSAVDPDEFRRRLRMTPGGPTVTVFLTRVQGRPWMVVGAGDGAPG